MAMPLVGGRQACGQAAILRVKGGPDGGLLSMIAVRNASVIMPHHPAGHKADASQCHDAPPTCPASGGELGGSPTFSTQKGPGVATVEILAKWALP
jgi:hypothetical protein